MDDMQQHGWHKSTQTAVLEEPLLSQGSSRMHCFRSGGQETPRIRPSYVASAHRDHALFSQALTAITGQYERSGHLSLWSGCRASEKGQAATMARGIQWHGMGWGPPQPICTSMMPQQSQQIIEMQFMG